MTNPATNVPIPDNTGTGNQLVLALPVFNAEEFLPATLESLNAQGSFLRWWLQDGASTDRTVEIARSFAREGDTVRSEPDAGQTDAINRAFRQMGGDIVGFINGDDLLATGAARRVLTFFNENPDIDLVYGRIEWIDRDGQTTGTHSGRIGSLSEMLDIYNVWWRKRQWVQPEVFFRRSLWEKVNGFDTRWDLAFDYDFWARCLIAGARIAHIPEVLARFRIHAAQKSSAREKAADEIRAIVRQHLDRRAPIGLWKRVTLRTHLDYDAYQRRQGAKPRFLHTLATSPHWLLVPDVRKRVIEAFTGHPPEK
jgi:glycosyltransferase involved in cell wall biosynthesis